MTQEEAMEMITDALKKTLNKKEVIFSRDSDLLKEEILDSLDSLVFFSELTELSGKTLPEEDLVELGFFKIENLVKFLVEG